MTINPNGQEDAPILIIGGGIGGLCFAAALGQKGIACRVLEAREEFSEIGAGVQLSPNAMRRLAGLGLSTALGTVAAAPSSIDIHDAINNKLLNSIPLGGAIETAYKAPYWVCARRDLQEALLGTVESLPSVALCKGEKFVTYTQNGAEITAEMEGGAQHTGALLVGADGLWSRVRQMIAPEAHPRHSGMVAWRVMLPARDVPSALLGGATKVWLGPGAHLVAYRVAGGEAVNLVAISPGKAPQRSWDEALAPEILFEALRPWQAGLRAAVMAVDGWRAWPLMMLAPFHPWHKGRMVLMGDAAHAVLPFLAQGAALAIEDAISLADLIAENRDDLMRVPAVFEAARHNRARRVYYKSIMNGRVYHAGAALRPVRNAALTALPGGLLLRQYGWVYDY